MATRVAVPTFDSYVFPDTTDWNETLNTRVSEVTIPRRHGSRIATDLYFTSRTITMRGTLYDTYSGGAAGATSARTLLDSLQAATSDRGDLYLYSDRYLKDVARKAFTYTLPDGVDARVINWQATFTAPDPFYYGATVAQTQTVTGASVYVSTSDNTAWSYPLIRLAPAGLNSTGLTVLVGIVDGGGSYDYKFRYTASITSGDMLTIDSETYTVTKTTGSASTDVIQYYSGDFLAFRPAIALLYLTVVADTNVDLYTQFSKRYL